MNRTAWLVAEYVVGIVSAIVAGVSFYTPGAEDWAGAFLGTGLLLISVVLAELVCANYKLCNPSSTGFSRVRMWAHFLNGLCWLTALLHVAAGKVLLGPVSPLVIPLLALNIWGAFEHAQAIWGDGRSIFRATADRLRCGNRDRQQPLA